MKRVILDTNMLLVPGQFKVDIFSEIERVMDEPYELAVLEGTLRELRKIELAGSAEDRRAARLGALLLEHQRAHEAPALKSGKCKGLKTISGSDAHVDDAILAIADDDTLVATNDSALKRRLLERGSRVIFLKQRQYLTIS